jgi:hypothetical protein
MTVCKYQGEARFEFEIYPEWGRLSVSLQLQPSGGDARVSVQFTRAYAHVVAAVSALAARWHGLGAHS